MKIKSRIEKLKEKTGKIAVFKDRLTKETKRGIIMNSYQSYDEIDVRVRLIGKANITGGQNAAAVEDVYETVLDTEIISIEP